MSLMPTLLKTGLSGLDRYSPLRRGDMPLIVGERKDGKSILALTLMSNMVGIGERGLYFSLESP
jgi:KaiC/GvpD/RAD55 family RecA-like ATPase